MKIKNECLFLSLIIILFLSLSSFFAGSPLWWDSAVYISMGKYIFSLGNIGLWEPARPLFLPFVLGMIWRSGSDIIIFGKVIALASSAASIVVLYLIARKIADKRSALIFSLLFSISLPIVVYGSKLMTDIPSMLFSVLSLYFIIRKENYPISGLFLGLAVLTKFTHLIFVAIILIFIIIRKASIIRRASRFLLGLSIAIVPFLIFNLIAYKNPLHTFIQANILISSVAGNYTCPSSALFYLKDILLAAPAILLFALFSLRDPETKIKLILLSLVVPFAYLSLAVNCKDIRYSFLFLPCFYILAAKGYSNLKKKRNMKALLLILVIAQILLSFSVVAYGYQKLQNNLHPYHEEFYSYLSEKEIKGHVWSSTPFVAAYNDVKIDEKVYYPVFDSRKIRYLGQNLDSDVQYILINSCDIPCIIDDKDKSCPMDKKNLLEKIRQRYDILYKKAVDNCTLTIYSWNKTR